MNNKIEDLNNPEGAKIEFRRLYCGDNKAGFAGIFNNDITLWKTIQNSVKNSSELIEFVSYRQQNDPKKSAMLHLMMSESVSEPRHSNNPLNEEKLSIWIKNNAEFEDLINSVPKDRQQQHRRRYLKSKYIQSIVDLEDPQNKFFTLKNAGILSRKRKSSIRDKKNRKVIPSTTAEERVPFQYTLGITETLFTKELSEELRLYYTGGTQYCHFQPSIPKIEPVAEVNYPIEATYYQAKIEITEPEIIYKQEVTEELLRTFNRYPNFFRPNKPSQSQQQVIQEGLDITLNQ